MMENEVDCAKQYELLSIERIASKAVVTKLGAIDQPHLGKPDAAVDIIQLLQNWVSNSPLVPYSVLLGEYGMGKTWACLSFVQEQLIAHKANPQLPTAIYLDLRRYNEGAKRSLNNSPMLTQIIETTLVREIDISLQQGLTAQMVIELVRNKGATVVFDGLDEVANHLSPLKRNDFFNQLASILPANHLNDKENSYKNPGKILISCRSNLFASLSEEANLFLKQQRGGQDASNYEVLRMLPFNEQQIREYIDRNLPGHDIDKVMELLNQVHNLRELAERPYNLSVLRHQIGRLESQRSAGQAILPIKLYQNLVEEWLERDEGKHIISKIHKPKIMMALAAYMNREGTRQLAHSEVAEWLDEWLIEFPSIADNVNRNNLQTDLRTATFIVRPDSDQFQFAHTSLMEYFLAEYLIQALEKNTLEHWEMPLVSDETFGFMVQLLHLLKSDPRRLAKVQTNFPALLECYTPNATELAFKFWLITQDEAIHLPRPIRIDCSGANLHKWRFLGSERKPLNLNNVDFSGAQLGFSCWHHLQLNNSLFKGSQLPSAEFISCNATGTHWESADLRYSQWRHIELQGGNFLDADMLGARVGHCDFTDAHYPQKRTTSLWHNNLGENANHAVIYDKAKFKPHILHAHARTIKCVAFSPDGRQILTGSEDGTAKLWDVSSGMLLLTLSHGYYSNVEGVAFSPDGLKLLIGGGHRNAAKLWDSTTGALLHVFEGHSKSINSVAYSPDGFQILTGSYDHTAKLWNTTTGALLHTLSGHTAAINSVAFSPNGHKLLTGSNDKTAKLWDASTGSELLSLIGHSDPITSVAYSPDGNHLLTGSEDATARIWRASDGVLLRTLKLSSWEETWLRKESSCVAYSPDGNQILTGAKSKYTAENAELWDSNSGALLLTLKGPSVRITSVAFSPDSRQLITASGNTFKLWDATSGALLFTSSGGFKSGSNATYSPDGQQLLTSLDFDTIQLWDANSGTQQLIFRLRREYSCFAYSPNSRQICIAESYRNPKLFDTATGELLLTLERSEYTWHTAFSPDGLQILTVGSGCDIWDTATGSLLFSLKGLHDVSKAEYSLDGRYLISMGEGTIGLWDSSSGTHLTSINLYHEYGEVIEDFTLSPDGRRLLTEGSSGLISWDTTTGAMQRILDDRRPCATFSPDGRWLLCIIGGEVEVWNGRTCAPLYTLKGHYDAIFSPNGAKILTYSEDNTAKLWGTETGSLLLTLWHSERVLTVTFSPDGRYLITRGPNTLTRWDAQTGQEIMTIHPLPNGEYVVSAPNSIIATSPEAWRYTYLKLKVPAEQQIPGRAKTLIIPADTTRALQVTSLGRQLTDAKMSAPDDSGLACLIILARFHGITANADQLALEFCLPGNIFGISEILLAAQKLSLGAKKISPFLACFDRTPMPAIAIAQNGKFFVVDKSDNETFKVYNPFLGEFATLNKAEFLLLWSGELIIFASCASVEDALEKIDTQLPSAAGWQFVRLGLCDLTAVRFPKESFWLDNLGKVKTQVEIYCNVKLRPKVGCGHSDSIRSIAYSPDGSKILTGSDDNTAKLWDAASGRVLHTLHGHKLFISSVAFSPCGERLLTGSFDSSAKLWDATSGTLLITLNYTEVPLCDSVWPLCPIWSVSFSPDGRQLLIGDNDSVRQWDATTGALISTIITTIKAHSEKVVFYGPDRKGIRCVAYSPNGLCLVTGSHEAVANLWDVAKSTLRLKLEGHSGAVLCATYSPNGEQLLTGSKDQTAKLWNAASGALLLTLEGHSAEICSLAFSPDGSRILTGSADKTARLWDATTGTALFALAGHSGDVCSVACSPDGRQLLTGSRDHTYKLWDIATGALLFTSGKNSNSRVDRAFYSPDGHQLATRLRDNSVNLWDSATGTLKFTWDKLSDLIADVCFSPDSRQLLITTEKTARLWDLATGSLLFKRNGDFSGAAFSPDGRMILTMGYGKSELWNASTGELQCAVDSSPDVFAFSPDSRLLLTTSDFTNIALLWDTTSGELLRTFKHEEIILNVAFSPDGYHCILLISARKASLWAAKDGYWLSDLDADWNFFDPETDKDFFDPEIVAYSPNGHQVLTNSIASGVLIWDSYTGEHKLTLDGHTSIIHTCAYSPNGLYILTGSYDNSAKLWDAATGILLRTFECHSLIKSVAFSPDSRQLLTVGSTSVKQWDIYTGEEIMTIYQLPNSEYVTTTPDDIISASTEAWRYACYTMEVPVEPISADMS